MGAPSELSIFVKDAESRAAGVVGYAELSAHFGYERRLSGSISPEGEDPLPSRFLQESGGREGSSDMSWMVISIFLCILMQN